MSSSKIGQALLRATRSSSGERRNTTHATPKSSARSAHSAQAMHTLHSVPIEVKEAIHRQSQKIARRVFAGRLVSAEDDFKIHHTAKPIAKVPHNGNEIRVAYHDCLGDIGLQMSQGALKGLLVYEEEFGPVIPALLMCSLREEVRMCAWDHMTAEDSRQLLMKRNELMHGRKEGPSVEILLEKYSKETPEMTEEQLWAKIAGKGLTSTSKKYDEDFGAETIAIRVSPSGDIESADERLARIAEEDAAEKADKPSTFVPSA